MAQWENSTSTEGVKASMEWHVPPPGAGTPGGTMPSEPDRPRSRAGWISWLSRIVLVAAIGTMLFGGYRAWAESAAVTERQDALAASFDRRLELVNSGLPLEAMAATGDPAVAATGEPEPVSDARVSDDPRMPEPSSVYTSAEIAALQTEGPQVPGILRELAPAKGEVLGRITIPSLDLEWMIVEGTELEYLKSGPGHMAWTPVPGQPGNAVISGHRTTYGAPFNQLDLLEPGDLIQVDTLAGTHFFEVYDTVVVPPDGVWVTHQWGGAWLTLTTCNPKGSARERLVVFAELIDGPNYEAVATSTERTPPEQPEGA